MVFSALRRLGRGLRDLFPAYAQNARGARRQVPVPVSEQFHQRGHEQRADHRGVEDDPGGEADREHLDLVARARREDEEGEHEDERGARDELAGAGQSELDRLIGRARLVVGLAHPREHEDLVVHREAVEEREDHQRDPGRDRLGGGDVPERGAVAVLKDDDDESERRGEREEVEDHGLEREHDRAERACEQDQREDEHEREKVREVAVDGVDEVSVDRRDAAECAVGARECGVGVVDDGLDSGCGAVDGRDRLDERVAAALPRGGRGRADDPGNGAHLGRDRRCALPPCSTSTMNGFIAPGLMLASASICLPAIAVPVPGKFLSCASFGFICKPVCDEHAHDCQAAERNRPRMAQHKPRPPAPGAVLGVALVDEPLRHHPQAVDPRAERCQQRRQQRDRRGHGDERDQHPTDAHRADERQRDHDQGEQTDGHRRPGDDHGAAGMRHRLHERGLDLCALAQLVAEAEDHQQRVVDRDAQPDERDQELDDDRDVRDVRQDPDQRERIQDRRHRDHERHQHRRQRAEHEEEDHERAERADHRLEQHSRGRRCFRACSLPRAGRGPSPRRSCRPGARLRPRPACGRRRSWCRTSRSRAGRPPRRSCAGRPRRTSGCRSRSTSSFVRPASSRRRVASHA